MCGDCYTNGGLKCYSHVEVTLGEFEFHISLCSIDLGVPSIGSPLTITIRPSHNAAGVFAFSASSSLVVVVEGASATVTIVRGGGSQGNASVSWFLVDQTGDLTPTSGTVTFTPGQTSAQFSITAVDDMVSGALYLELLVASLYGCSHHRSRKIPEFQEVYRVMLINATDGSRLNTTGLLVANISIPANHYPCGLFVFDVTYRSLLVDFMVGRVELAVSREFGTAGNVGVTYTTLDSNSTAVSSLVPPEKYVIVYLIFDMLRYSLFSSPSLFLLHPSPSSLFLLHPSPSSLFLLMLLHALPPLPPPHPCSTSSPSLLFSIPAPSSSPPPPLVAALQLQVWTLYPLAVLCGLLRGRPSRHSTSPSWLTPYQSLTYTFSST